MHQIKLGKGRATIDFNPFLYPQQVLEAAARQFKGVCKTKISPSPSRIAVELIPGKGIAAKEAALQFCNAALTLRQAGD